MWGSENPIEHVSNPTLNTRNFPHVNTEVVFGIKLQTLPTPDYILDQMMSESLKATKEGKKNISKVFFKEIIEVMSLIIL